MASRKRVTKTFWNKKGKKETTFYRKNEMKQPKDKQVSYECHINKHKHCSGLAELYDHSKVPCKCKCHSPRNNPVCPNKRQLLRQEGEDAKGGVPCEHKTRRSSKVPRDKKLVAGSTTPQVSSPSSFDMHLSILLHFFNDKPTNLVIKEIKGLVERDYIEKQKVFDALKRFERNIEKLEDMEEWNKKELLIIGLVWKSFENLKKELMKEC